MLLHKIKVAFICYDSWNSSQLVFCPASSISVKNSSTLPISCCQVTVQAHRRTKANSIAGKMQEKKEWPWTKFHLTLLGALVLARPASKAYILVLFLQERTHLCTSNPVEPPSGKPTTQCSLPEADLRGCSESSKYLSWLVLSQFGYLYPYTEMYSKDLGCFIYASDFCFQKWMTPATPPPTAW